MAIEQNHSAARYLRTIFVEGIAAELTDRELLERFAGRAGEASELAFAALVARHGPMVLHACRAALRDEHDGRYVAAARQDGITLILRLPDPSATHDAPARRTMK